MRANEFLLLEYNQEKTTQVFGPKLLAAFLKDAGNFPSPSLDRLNTNLLSKDMEGIQIDQETIAHTSRLLLGFLENADPTPHKQYTQWLAKVYANQEIKLEDLLSKGADWLETYHSLKSHRLLPPNLNDINRLTFQQLYNVVFDPELVGVLTSAKTSSMPKGQSKEILNNTVVRIIHPLDIDAARYYGNGTTWCTSAKNNCMFNEYNKDGPLFILLPKQPKYNGEKYQIHAGSGQFMNEEDEPVDPIDLVIRRFGDILPVLKAIDPTFNNLIMFADGKQIDSMIDQVKVLSLDFISGTVMDWESQDDTYYTWLADNGYITKDGDHTDDAPTYFEYNPESEHYYNYLTRAVDPSVRDVRDMASKFSEVTGDNATLDRFEDLMAFIVSSYLKYEGVSEDLSDWIESNLTVKDGQVVRLIKDKHPKK